MQSNEPNPYATPTFIHPDERQKWLQALAVNMVALNKYAVQQAMHGQGKVRQEQAHVHQDQAQDQHEQGQVHQDKGQVQQESDHEKLLIKHEQVLSLRFRITDVSKGFYEYESLSEEEKQVLPKTTLEVMRDVAEMVEGPKK